ncbi:MAG TPA: argininosuccinate synthase [Bacteroidota bacterium]|nr:argininosuccinate synthase [Bacteroidota bacterium]
MSERPKIVLAFSGGLDTTYCAVHLAREMGADVYTATVNTGGFTAEECDAIEARALALGAVGHRTIDATREFYTRCIRYLVYGNVLRGGVYPLSVSAERVFQAEAIARHARELGATHVAHGSTGAGNDQVRFDSVFHILLPGVPILTPIRDHGLSRDEEIARLRAHGVEGQWERAPYSINQGLWGTSVGGRETLGSTEPLPEEAWPVPVTRDDSETVELRFERGEIVDVNARGCSDSIEAIRALERIAAPFGVGRDIHIGDTIIGMKGRVGFAAAAPLIIIKAHHALEKHTLTRQQQLVKEQLAAVYGGLVHEAQFLDPAARDIEALFERSQRHVTGTVRVRLAPYRFHILGVDTPHDLMASRFGAYGEEQRGWTGDDVRGFSRIHANQAMIHHAVHDGEDA